MSEVEIPDADIRRAADLVADGVADLEDYTAPADVDDEAFRDAVEAELERRQDDDGRDEPAQPTITDGRNVDWQALWQEFGFDEADANGVARATPVQLETALTVTEQPVAGNPRAMISDAVDADILVERNAITTSIGAIETGLTTSGYRLVGGDE